MRRSSTSWSAVRVSGVVDAGLPAWNIQDTSTTGGKAIYYQRLTKKERAAALACGFRLRTVLRVDSCSATTIHVAVKFDANTRWVFFFCLAGGNVYVHPLANLVNCTISRHLILRTCRIIRTTMSSNDFLATSDGQGANTYVEYDFVYDPSVSTTGIVIYAGVPGTLLLPLNDLIKTFSVTEEYLYISG